MTWELYDKLIATLVNVAMVAYIVWALYMFKKHGARRIFIWLGLAPGDLEEDEMNQKSITTVSVPDSVASRVFVLMECGTPTCTSVSS